MKPFFIALLGICLSSCAGYQRDGAKPPSLAGIKSIAVPMFVNGTQHPRAETLVTSAVVSAFVEDGTYRVEDRSKADAVLEGELRQIDYASLRSSRYDSLLAEELTNHVQINWILRDAKDPTKILASGKNDGYSSFFVDSNLQTARHNALPDALKRASKGVVSQLSSGY